MVRYYGSSAIGIGMIECFLLVNTLTNNHSGTIELTQAGTSITGYSNWSTHSNGPITGTINGDSINFKITYPDGI